MNPINRQSQAMDLGLAQGPRQGAFHLQRRPCQYKADQTGAQGAFADNHGGGIG